MTLSLTTLQRLIAKDGWAETRCLTDSRLASLEAGAEHKVGLKIWTRDRTLLLDAKGSIAASLEPKGSSYCALGDAIYALAREPFELLRWQLSDPHTVQRQALPGPVTLLRCDPQQQQWLSWLAADPQYRCWTQSLDGSRTAEVFWTIPGLPYGLEWHAQRSLCLVLVCPSHLTPWQGAALFLLAYTRSPTGPKLLQEQRIGPPGLREAPCQEASFSADGQSIIGLWRSDEWNQVWSYQLDTQLWTQKSFNACERGRPRRRSDGKSLVSVGDELIGISHERGYFRLEALRPGDAEWTPLLPREYTFLEQLESSPEGDRLSLVSAAAQMPPTQIELGRSGTQWSLQGQRGAKAAYDSYALQGEALSWPAEDGQMVHGFLYRDRRRRGPLPLLLPIHGGPTEQVCASWPVKAQAFVESGYAVLYVNYRGSWGYGRTYQEALAGRWGERDVKDIVSSLAPLAAADWIDPRRVALWGGGLGASVVLKTLQLYPQLFRAAIAVYPLCDFEDYWGKAGALQRAELDVALGTCDAEGRKKKSLLHGFERIQTPLALFHGGRDPLVPLAHVEALAASLENRRVPCWLTVYPEEAHAWQARATLEDYYCKIGSFLARFLRKEV